MSDLVPELSSFLAMPASWPSWAASLRPPTCSEATHSTVSSPATVPMRPFMPPRSSADATTWAQPGGVRTTTRLPLCVTSATHSPTTRRSWSDGATRCGSNSGMAYFGSPPATRTLTAPSSSRSREIVACVASTLLRASSFCSSGWLDTLCDAMIFMIICWRCCLLLIPVPPSRT